MTHPLEDENRRLREAMATALQHLEKGRALWNGPCHQCAYVLRDALGMGEQRALAAEPTSGEAFEVLKPLMTADKDPSRKRAASEGLFEMGRAPPPPASEEAQSGKMFRMPTEKEWREGLGPNFNPAPPPPPPQGEEDDKLIAFYEVHTTGRKYKLDPATLRQHADEATRAAFGECERIIEAEQADWRGSSGALERITAAIRARIAPKGEP